MAELVDAPAAQAPRRPGSPLDVPALERTLAVTRKYAVLCREHGVERIRFVATSATRDTANRTEFTDVVFAILGAPAEVILGTEEAALSFRGALTALTPQDTDAAISRHLLIDLGGGSIELVPRGSVPNSAYSMASGACAWPSDTCTVTRRSGRR